MQSSKFDKQLNPLNDYLFYMVMGEQGDEVQLISFLNAVLHKSGKKIDAIESFENKYLAPDVINGKGCILDVRVRLHDRTVINIELQIENKRNMEKRTLYYSSKLINKSIKKADDYIELPKIIAINIINFDFLVTDNHHTIFKLREDTEHDIILTDSLEIHFINMVKWRRKFKRNFKSDALDMWLTWLDKKNKPELAKEVIKMDCGIEAAEARLRELIDDDEVMQLYEMREKARLDWNSSINYARREGLTEGEARGHAKGLTEGEARGRAEGLTEGRIETARKMKAEELSYELIQKITDLSLDEIEKL